MTFFFLFSFSSKKKIIDVIFVVEPKFSMTYLKKKTTNFFKKISFISSIFELAGLSFFPIVIAVQILHYAGVKKNIQGSLEEKNSKDSVSFTITLSSVTTHIHQIVFLSKDVFYCFYPFVIIKVGAIVNLVVRFQFFPFLHDRSGCMC